MECGNVNICYCKPLKRPLFEKKKAVELFTELKQVRIIVEDMDGERDQHSGRIHLKFI